MGWQTLEEQVLHKAVEVLGSERALASALRITRHDLALFLSGAERPTRSIFLAACDILIERGDETANANRDGCRAGFR